MRSYCLLNSRSSGVGLSWSWAHAGLGEKSWLPECSSTKQFALSEGKRWRSASLGRQNSCSSWALNPWQFTVRTQEPETLPFFALISGPISGTWRRQEMGVVGGGRDRGFSPLLSVNLWVAFGKTLPYSGCQILHVFQQVGVPSNSAFCGISFRFWELVRVSAPALIGLCFSKLSCYLTGWDLRFLLCFFSKETLRPASVDMLSVLIFQQIGFLYPTLLHSHRAPDGTC